MFTLVKWEYKYLYRNINKYIYSTYICIYNKYCLYIWNNIYIYFIFKKELLIYFINIPKIYRALFFIYLKLLK